MEIHFMFIKIKFGRRGNPDTYDTILWDWREVLKTLRTVDSRERL